jgi:hypothetical protein
LAFALKGPPGGTDFPAAMGLPKSAGKISCILRWLMSIEQ